LSQSTHGQAPIRLGSFWPVSALVHGQKTDNRIEESITEKHKPCSARVQFSHLVRDQVLGPKVPEATPLVSMAGFREVVEVWCSLMIFEDQTITKSTTLDDRLCSEFSRSTSEQM
jgi:hypothetical protein